MISAVENAVELEAMRREDSSWHACQVSLCSTGIGLFVKFESEKSEETIFKNEEEAVTHLRMRSLPLRGDDCSKIAEGEHVLAAHKSQFKIRLFDAEVQKVLRVRHSTRVYCRCNFEITWLNQELKEETVTLPSTSIRKLAKESIKTDPTIAAFLDSLQSLDQSSPPPCLSSLPQDMDCEMDLHNLVGKQIEDIGCLIDPITNENSEDTFLQIKEVTHKQNQGRRSNKSQSKLQMEIEFKDPPLSALLGNRSYLSPLAARAALASLISKDWKLPQKLDLSLDSEIDQENDIVESVGDENISVADKIVKSSMSAETDAMGNPQQMGKFSRVLVKETKTRETISRNAFACTGIISTSSVALEKCMDMKMVNPPVSTMRLTRSAIRRRHLISEAKLGLVDHVSIGKVGSDSDGKVMPISKSILSRKEKLVSPQVDDEIDLTSLEKRKKKQKMSNATSLHLKN